MAQSCKNNEKVLRVGAEFTSDVELVGKKDRALSCHAV